MGWFRKVFTNPNTHIAIGTAATIASAVFPQFALPLQAVAVVFGGTGIALPEQPAAPVVEHSPVVLPSGATLHSADYAAILGAVASVLAKKK